MADNGTPKNALSPRQRRALMGLLTQSTIRAAAQAAGLGERTIHRFLENPHFEQAFEAARSAAEEAELEAHRDLLRQRLAAARAALAEAERMLRDPETPAAVRAALVTRLLEGSDGVADRLALRWATRSREHEDRREGVFVRWNQAIQRKFQVIDAEMTQLEEGALPERTSAS